MRNNIIMPTGFSRSASRINLYNTCPRCFYLKYILWTPYTDEQTWLYDYGNKIHNSIESLSLGNQIDYEVSDFDWDEEKYQKYYEHMVLYRERLGDQNVVSEIEFLYQDEDITDPIYWFFDWIILQKKVNWKIRAVKILQDQLLRYVENEKEEISEIPSKFGYIGGIEILWFVEFKTQAKTRSYNDIKTNTQFAIYNHIKNIIAPDTNYTLLCFNTKDWKLQKAMLTNTEQDYEKVKNKIKEISEKMKWSDDRVSSCWYYSQYASICKDFTF